MEKQLERLSEIEKIISKSQLEKLHEQGFIVVREEDARNAIEFADWRYDLINEAYTLLHKADIRHPKEKGLNGLKDAIDHLDTEY
ncbi:hypothetical protein BEP19_04750 [Ammoniphilus oxalaticus]|uniref:Uncharacterized protein n=1 Tax=Ammoniphilus oxalaticus TaxID=66863 RepID=A0A419SM30_9BACL|nr:hypothetical protein [Ammoniphilus oxalaticus]RKD25130.1 hypothetical protein BEP19_04750 [Ammoniphilus oxalaticus]